MKTNNYFTLVRRGCTGLIFGILSIIVHAQTKYTIEGSVSYQNGETVAYANVAIRELPDSSLVGGTITGEDGTFSFQHSLPGTFLVTARFIGYAPAYVTIEAPGGVAGDASKQIIARCRHTGTAAGEDCHRRSGDQEEPDQGETTGGANHVLFQQPHAKCLTNQYSAYEHDPGCSGGSVQ